MIPVVLSPLQEEIALGRAKEKAKKRQREARKEIERETKRLRRSRSSWLYAGYATHTRTNINAPQTQQEPSSGEVQKARKYKPTFIDHYLVDGNSRQQQQPRVHMYPDVGRTVPKPLKQQMITSYMKDKEQMCLGETHRNNKVGSVNLITCKHSQVRLLVFLLHRT